MIMKRLILPTFFVLMVCAVFAASGQAHAKTTGTSPEAGDKSIGENPIRIRSVEMQQMKRALEKMDQDPAPTINSKVESKFPEIKEDFEGIQTSEAAIIKTYTTDKTIDYRLIEISANDINKRAKRLDVNLFAEEVTKREDAEDEEPPASLEKTKSVRDIIVALDNAIGSFSSSKIFGNLKVIDPEVAIQTRADLTKIQELSEALAKEAGKLK